ncbi:MAG: alanine racemase [Oligoflexia bacterium]|nr:alanine racemase [Oligoflexia bacterium]
MQPRLRNSFVEIDLRVLEQNFRNLSQAMGSPEALAPMVKADAYGHGDIHVAKVCEAMGARFMGVALIEEGIRLRQAGIQSSLLVFSHFDATGAEAMVKYRLTPVVSQLQQIEKLKAALHDQARYPIHLKFNTGMQRLGFEPEQVTEVLAKVGHDSFFKIEGACTHFASSEDYGTKNSQTAEQLKAFESISRTISQSIDSKVLFHTHKSSALMTNVEPKLDLARPGLALYGAYSKLDVKPKISVMPVMAVKSFIGFIHKIKKGTKVSYGGTWSAPKDGVIAVLPIGYADGIPRALSNKGEVLIRGVRCPMIGIVCMDYIMVDVSALANQGLGPELGDEVVLIGEQKGQRIRPEDMAERASTISYEIMTGMQSRLARVYIH